MNGNLYDFLVMRVFIRASMYSENKNWFNQPINAASSHVFELFKMQQPFEVKTVAHCRGRGVLAGSNCYVR